MVMHPAWAGTPDYSRQCGPRQPPGSRDTRPLALCLGVWASACRGTDGNLMWTEHLKRVWGLPHGSLMVSARLEGCRTQPAQEPRVTCQRGDTAGWVHVGVLNRLFSLLALFSFYCGICSLAGGIAGGHRMGLNRVEVLRQRRRPPPVRSPRQPGRLADRLRGEALPHSVAERPRVHASLQQRLAGECRTLCAPCPTRQRVLGQARLGGPGSPSLWPKAYECAVVVCDCSRSGISVALPSRFGAGFLSGRGRLAGMLVARMTPICKPALGARQ